MLLILTHENADFDAVASQLAAYKLYPQGVPLLSWRVNRNVEQFLTLYWDAFPFMRPSDWRRQRVKRVLLVDTLTLPSVRGIRADRVEVQVIDHHDLEDNIVPDWSYHSEMVGATTTLLVEMLQIAGHTLTINEATLLLLGIHEDTGSLVYDTTTSRDVQATAWLMEQGAQLKVVRRFLNIPLSNTQQRLNELIQESAEWVTIEGHSILISAVTAPEGFDDEISAIAHRVRDSLMPDAMFLLVQLKYNHVQLVARSSTDNIDVSIIAKKLGGGGHSRAAAATVMDSNIEKVRSDLIDWLPGIVKPTVKVSQIMSYGVQTIDSSESINKAASQMQRSGHEGYPVIDSESRKLIGLLTRRLVDRAVSHKLGDLPVKQIMRAGQITVKPSDSVEKVQRLMTEEGWGQIPVISENENSGKDHGVIGIVTRTDLIGLLNEERSSRSEPDMRRLMKRRLPDPVWRMVKTIGEVSSEREIPLYFVGGLVRDLLVGRSPQDIDMVTEGDAIELVRYLRERYGGEIRSHQQFGTAKWLIEETVWKRVDPEGDVADVPSAIDFVTARTEFYDRPTALPEVERGSIKLDLHRRDFTINTLAIRLDGAHLGELLDFYGGFRDLDQGVIRVLHSLSFIDDPTRILRAIRLEQRLGFDIEPRTSELISAALPMLDRVTGERIRNELEMCLEEDERVNIMARLAECGVLGQIHPGLIWHDYTADYYVTASDLFKNGNASRHFPDVSDVFVYFALLLVSLSKSVQNETMSRLKVRKTTRDDVIAADQLIRQLSNLEQDANPSDIYRLLKSFRERVIVVAWVVIKPTSNLGLKVSRYLSEWRYIKTSLNGNDLIERGLEPGPQIGEILQRLLTAKLDGEISDEVDELRFLDEILQNEVI